jgi:hypothetical protein
MELMLIGNIELNIMGQNDFNLENFAGAYLTVTRPDGSKAEFTVNEILHKDLTTIDEFGNEI